MCALKKLKEEWKVLADQLLLNFDPGSFFKNPEVKGMYRGYNVILDTYTVSTGQTSVTYTRLSVDISNPKDVFLRIYHEGFLSRIGKKLGLQDIQTKNPDFDDMFMIKGNNELEAITILDLDIQAKILSLREPNRFNAKIKGQKITFEESGIIKDIERLKSTLDMLIDIAEKLKRLG